MHDDALDPGLPTAADSRPEPPDAVVLKGDALPEIAEMGRRQRRREKDAARKAAIEAGFVPPPTATLESLESGNTLILAPTGYKVAWDAVRARSPRAATVEDRHGRLVSSPVTTSYWHGDIIPAGDIDPDDLGRLLELEAITPVFTPLPDRAVALAGS